MKNMNGHQNVNEFNEFKTAMDVITKVSQLHEAERTKEEMQSTFSSLLKVSEEKVKGLDAVIEPYTTEQLQAMSDDEIKALYVIDGHELVFDIEVEDSKMIEFKRDFLVYMKELDTYGKEIDKTIGELENTLKEHDVEYRSLVDKFGSMYLIVRGQMEEILKNPTSEEQKHRAEAMLSAMDNAISLDVLLKYVDEYNFENMLFDYKSRPNGIFKKYKTVLRRLGIRTDITKLVGLEQALGLDEELKYPNLCMFLAIRYIAYSKNPTKEVEGMFISNLALVYKAVIEGTIREEDKARLVIGCKTIIDKAIALQK